MWSLSQPNLLLVTIDTSLVGCENLVGSLVRACGALITLNPPAPRLSSSLSAVSKDRGAGRTHHVEDESEIYFGTTAGGRAQVGLSSGRTGRGFSSQNSSLAHSQVPLCGYQSSPRSGTPAPLAQPQRALNFGTCPSGTQTPALPDTGFPLRSSALGCLKR